MAILMFSGGELLSLIVGCGGGVALLLGMFVWAIRGPKNYWIVPLIYVASWIGITWVSMSEDASLSDAAFPFLVLVSFPWSLLLVVLNTAYDQNLAEVWCIPGIFVNAAIIFYTARRSRRSVLNV